VKTKRRPCRQSQQSAKTGLHRHAALGGYPRTDKAPADQRRGQPKRAGTTKVIALH
jgi:hypothetical protein